MYTNVFDRCFVIPVGWILIGNTLLSDWSNVDYFDLFFTVLLAVGLIVYHWTIERDLRKLQK